MINNLDFFHLNQCVSYADISGNFTFIVNDGLCSANRSTQIKFDVRDLSQQDIIRRYKILNTLIAHTEKFLGSLLQNGQFAKDKSFFTDNFFTIVTSNNCNFPIGAWNVHINFQNQIIPVCYTDIIGLYAITRSKSYRQSIIELESHIENNKSIYHDNQNKPSWFLQEKNPIHVDKKTQCDFFLSSIKELGSTYVYLNKYNNIIGENIVFKNHDAEIVSVFYIFLKRFNSNKLYYISSNPIPPFMFYFENFNNNFDLTFIHKDYESLKKLSYSNAYNVVNSMGYLQIHSADLSEIPTKQILIEYDASRLSLDYFFLLKESESRFEKEILFYDKDNEEFYFLNSLINAASLEYSSLHPNEEYFFTTPVPPGMDFPNQNRVRKKILQPIIESGTITWLFAQEKSGKTLIALTIAYIVSKGNLSLGTWWSEEPLSVLYVDGEMPGDKLGSLCSHIMRGYGETGDKLYRPFAAYLFREQAYDYMSILDDDWISKNFRLFFSYDLIIFDNYYTLNENNINVKPFITLLNKITRKDIAVVIVDHTNSSGELQGSIVKRRAMDLGIHLDVINDQTIDIGYMYDRYGVASSIDETRLLKVFTSTEYQWSVLEKYNESNQESLSENEFYCLFSYIFKKILDIKQVEISKLFNKSQQRISDYVKSADCFIKDTNDGKHRIKNRNKFKSELDRLSLLNQDDLLNQFIEIKKQSHFD
jgi:hypothetical protein